MGARRANPSHARLLATPPPVHHTSTPPAAAPLPASIVIHPYDPDAPWDWVYQQLVNNEDNFWSRVVFGVTTRSTPRRPVCTAIRLTLSRA